MQLRNYIRSIAGDTKVMVEPCEGKSKYAISNLQEGTFEFDIEDCLLDNNLSLIQTLFSVGDVSSFRCASGASAISLLCDGHLYPCTVSYQIMNIVWAVTMMGNVIQPK